jgi:hypothetical protein
MSYADLLRLFGLALQAKFMGVGAPRKRRRGQHRAMERGAVYVAGREHNRHGAPGSNWKTAYGPGSYAEFKAGQAAKRAARRAA